jgi:hypothetical protein
VSFGVVVVLLFRWGVDGVSGDMACYGVHRVRTSQVSHSLGLPAPLLVLLSLLNALTSHLDGEEGGSMVVPGHGSFRIDTSSIDPKK